MSNRSIELEATLRLALEALENPDGLDEYNRSISNNAITAIKEALSAERVAQPEQEPQPPYKFERYVSGSLRAQGVMVERATKLADAMRIAAKICPPANPPSAPTVLVYTTPYVATPRPQRKPLTDEQIDAVMPQPTEFGIVQPPWNGSDITILRAMSRAIEAAHGIKE